MAGRKTHSIFKRTKEEPLTEEKQLQKLIGEMMLCMAFKGNLP